MAKTNFNEVLQASNDRRSWGANAYSNTSAAGDALAAIADTLHAGSTESTTAVGLYKGGWVLIAGQGSSLGHVDAIDTAIRVQQALNLQRTPAGLIVNLTVPSDTGLHAEMMIVRYLSMLDVPKGHLSADLVVGVTKGCCLDCAGFLNKYYVTHNIPPGGVEPNPTQQWRHPYTYACYSGGKEIDHYMKNYKSLSPYS